MADIQPKGKKVKSMGGTHLTEMDAGTRTTLHMDIGPKTLKGAGSGKVTSNVQSTIAQANKGLPKK